MRAPSTILESRSVLAALLCFFTIALVSAPPAQANPTELFMSEYIEGSSFNKAIEIYNGTGAAIDLAAGDYELEFYFNGSGSAGTTIDLTGTVADGDVFVVADNDADADILMEADQTSLDSFFNGDDAVVLRKGGAVIDSIGQVGNDPGSEWSSGGVGTQNETIRRLIGVCLGDLDETDAFDPSATWEGFSNNTFDGLGSHTVNCGALSGWIINEIHADPNAVTGDANGDSTASLTEDEFIEIVNNNGSTIDISGWTLSDNTSVRHTFPASTVLPNGCAIVIFGGGTLGALGDAIVQAASTGGLDLDDSGDTLTLNNGVVDLAIETYGMEAANDQSITRDPDITGGTPLVTHSTATGSMGSLFSPGTLIDGTNFASCTPPPTPMHEIFEIQGNGAASPFDGQMITTKDNVVTAVGPEGFFIQTPDARDDADPDTSNGIYVFTGSAPTVSVGDLVDVTGEVDEFFDFTEFTNTPIVSIVGTEALPAPIIFNSMRPSPNSTPSCAIEFECYEGMIISIPSGTVAAPNQTFGSDPIAEVFIVASDQRPFREPGIEGGAVLSPPAPPSWDGNPEIFELDPDKLGLINERIPGGSTFNAVGALGFEFGGYELWASVLNVTPAPLPRPVRAKGAKEMTIGSLNLFRLFDDVDDPGDDTVVSTAEYDRRRAKFVLYILDVLLAPDVLGLQEVESLSVLQDLAADIAAADPSVSYTAFLEEGNDVGGIDVGFLVRSDVTVDQVTQLGKDEILTFDGSLLNDRPPLLLEGRYTGNMDDFPFAVMVLHGRSLGGIDGGEGDRVRQKRLEQAQSVAQKIQDFQTGMDAPPLFVIGDFNAFEFTDGYVDVTGQMAGDFVPAENTLSGPDLVDPNLDIRVLDLPAEERYSFIFRGSAQTLDNALSTQNARPFVRGFEFGRGNADASFDLLQDDSTPLRSSDHDGFVLYVEADATIFEDTFESGDTSLWSRTVQ